MLNTLDDYIPHTLPGYGEFFTNPALEMKVDASGRLLPFYGDTVVFILSDEAKRALALLQDELYSAAPMLLAQRLDPDSFHMTLHDLSNAARQDAALISAMVENGKAAKEHIARWQGRAPLHMKATWLFNMVNTSIVLGLVPADDESRRALEEMYDSMESVISLGYPLCPHVTMAYFRPGTYSQTELASLRRALRPVELDVELCMDKLCYQRFTDMNHYFTY